MFIVNLHRSPGTSNPVSGLLTGRLVAILLSAVNDAAAATSFNVGKEGCDETNAFATIAAPAVDAVTTVGSATTIFVPLPTSIQFTQERVSLTSAGTSGDCWATLYFT